MKRVSIILLFLAISLGSASAADRPVKPALKFSEADSLLRFSHEEKYSVSAGRIGNLYEFVPYDPLRIRPAEPVKYPAFSARLGVQFPLAPSAALDFNKSFSNRFALDIAGSHESFLSSLSSVGESGSLLGRLSDNTLKAGLKYAWDVGEITFGVRYDYFDRHYSDGAGDDRLDTGHSDGKFGIWAGICSTKEDDGNLYYKLNLNYSSLGAEYHSTGGGEFSLNENTVNVSGFAGTNFGLHRVYVDMKMEVSSYSDAKDYTTAIVEFSPLYEYNKGRFSGKFGVTFGNRFGSSPVYRQVRMDDGNNISAVSTVFPNVDARIEMVRNYLWARLVLDGGYEMNSYSSLSANCLLLSPDTGLRLGCKPLDAAFSIESVVSGRFAMNLSARYALERNKPLISPVVDNSAEASRGMCRIRSWDMNVNTFTLAAEAVWKSSSFTLGGNIKYNINRDEAGDTVMELPALTAGAYLRYNWRQRIVFSADFDYAGSVSGDKWGPYELPPVLNLNACITYNMNRHFSIFARFRNLLNSDNQYVPTYIEPGLNIGGGVALSF